MERYLYGLIALAVVCGIVEQLCPAIMAKHMRLLTGICLLFALLSPIQGLYESGVRLPDALSDLLDFMISDGRADALEHAEERWQEELLSLDAANVVRTLSLALQERFGIAASDITVGVTLNEAGDALSRVSVGLSGHAIWQDTHAIEAYIRQILGCEVLVYIQ